MESANKAMMMAGGMLFAIMVMSLVAFVFSRLTTIPTEEDSKILIQQATAFNNEYTAYDKRIMYGVDIISVLNKAKSNNDKYVLEKFVTGGGYNTDFIIDIEVRLKNTLEESMVVSYIEQTATGVVERDYIGKGPFEREGLTSFFKASDKFKAPDASYQNLIYGSIKWSNLNFINKTYPTKVLACTYHLLGNDTDISKPQPGAYKNDQLEATDNTLKKLLEYSTEMSQTIKNRNDNIFLPYGWTEATWYPATYDLKTRKFKCLGDQTVYSEKTGRIIKMVFEEI